MLFRKLKDLMLIINEKHNKSIEQTKWRSYVMRSVCPSVKMPYPENGSKDFITFLHNDREQYYIETEEAQFLEEILNLGL